MSQFFAEITVEELGRQLAETNAEKLQLVDVREPHEIELAALPGFAAFPLSEFAEWSGEIDASTRSRQRNPSSVPSRSAIGSNVQVVSRSRIYQR